MSKGRQPWPELPEPYTYDAASNRTSLTAPDTSITAYGYDTLNRLNGLANTWAGSFGFGYDALSRRTSLTRPNGVNTSYAYDSVSHLLSVLHQAGLNTLDGASYTYDSAGNRTSKTNYLDGVTSNYGYDPLYELTQVTQGASTTESYNYDAVGNRLSSLGVPSYSYNSSNELTSNSVGSYSYDANGNTLSDAQGRGFTWDFENRLTQATVPGTGTTTFKYDPFGRRIQKSGPLGTTNYLYDGANLLEEIDSSGSVLARYTQDVGIDQLLSQLRSGTTSYYEQDALGSVVSLSDGSGALAKTYSYDSFGKLTASTGTLTNSFQYTGREFDPETGLYFYRARYFDPSAGRFLSEDPLAFGAGDPNFYAYTGNSPTNMIDPSGKSAGAAPALGQAPAYCAANPVVCLGAIDGILLAYDSYEAYQLGVAYGWWGQPKPKQCDDDCGKLLAAIAAQMQIVQSRYAALMSDPLNLYNLAYSTPSASMPGAGTWSGHVDALADAQRGLQNRINAAKAKGCPIPPQAEFLAELPLPTKPGWRK